VSLVTGTLLVIFATTTRAGAAVYSLTLSGLFGISALYHRPSWRPEIQRWLQRLDHGMIYLLIAGTFTPVSLAIGTVWARAVLLVVWCAALLGIVLQLVPPSFPRPVAVIPYLALGWLGLLLVPQIVKQVGFGVPVLLLVGGVLYTLGAVVYARRAPNPKPAVFGYHEIFHGLVVLAAYFHYAAVALAVS
jgi:hemolysin III